MRRLLDSTAGTTALTLVAALFLMASLGVLAASRPAAETRTPERTAGAELSDTRTPARTVAVELGEEEALRVTYVGDSLTAGLFASTEDQAFRALTTAALAAGRPYEEQGTAIVGGTVQRKLELNEQLPQDQHLYVVELGTNDVTRVDYQTFATQYETLLERVRDASPDAALVCLGSWRPPAQGASYDVVIRQLCEIYDGAYRRLADLQAEPSYRGPEGVETFEGPSDEFHPNDAGHRAIHERIMSAVTVSRGG